MGVEGADPFHDPTRAGLAHLREVRRRIVWVRHCRHSCVHVGRQSVDCIEQRLRDSDRFIQKHEHVLRMNTLESGLIVVSRLATVGDELLTHIPLGVERDASREIAFPVRLADLSPQDRFNLSSGRRSCHDKRLADGMHV
jgi:hypothetical protein